MMKKSIPASSPEAYVSALDGWRRTTVENLRRLVLGSAPMAEVIKWRHLVYTAGGPVLLIRAEDTRVLFGFWRGQRLHDIEPRLKAGGSYEMATIELREEDDPISDTNTRRLVKAAVALNQTLGDPTKATAPKKSKTKNKG